MATIHVDGKQYEVDGADNLLQACLSLGLDIPYFCWHPALGSVGACRQCAVKQYANADDKNGRIVMSCMTPAQDGSWISISDDEAKAFRTNVVEWLMTNHPHDCPVCEEGGHCHLQDMVVMTGHDHRRHRFPKRTHLNQNLGSFIRHEMNRCIACYRCVRYYGDYAGGTDLGVYGAHDNVYFGRIEEGALESEFSGNLVEVCPTGVFTDKTHSQHYSRKWDMQFAPSICQQCSVGCNISPGERYGELRRIENRYNGSVNHYFLCDRGRFGYGYVNREDRPRRPALRDGQNWQECSLDKALDDAIALLSQAKRAVGIGSPRASIETNFALRALVGKANFSNGTDTHEQNRLDLTTQILRESGLTLPSLRDIEEYDAVLIVGEDVTQTAPRIALAVRQAVKGRARKMTEDRKLPTWLADVVRNIGQHEKNPLYITSFQTTRLDDVSTSTLHGGADEQAVFAQAVAQAIDPTISVTTELSGDQLALARQVAAALCAAQRPLIISGTSAGSAEILQASANVGLALKAIGRDVGISLVVPEVNSLGVALLGGQPLDEILDDVIAGRADALVIAENDLYRRAPIDKVDAALAAAKTLIVLDHQRTETALRAHVLLAAASFAEGDGTVISQEGRAQRYFQVYDPAWNDDTVQIYEGWRWLHALETGRRGAKVEWTHLDDVIDACVAAEPMLAAIREAAPDARFRIKGLKLARESRRYSGRTSMRADVSVHEPRASQDLDSALAHSMEGYVGPLIPAALTAFAWAPGWNSPSAWNKFQDEVGGHSRTGDAGARLFGNTPAPGLPYFAAPSLISVSTGRYRVAPIYHLYGSDEMASRAEVTHANLPRLAIVLSPADAARVTAGGSQTAIVRVGGTNLRLPVTTSPSLPEGVVGLYAGLPGMPAFVGEASIQIIAEVQ